MDSIHVKLGFSYGFHVDRVKYGGGLSLLWNDSLDLTIASYSRGHIDAHIRQLDGVVWRLTGFYGNPKTAEMHHSWRLLRRLSTLANLPWLCMGDFNEVMYQQEKDGARPASLSQMDSFKMAVEDCGLRDMAAVNGLFTWFGWRHSTYVREKLDRALANHDWSTLFQFSTVSLQATMTSDHLPLLIYFARSAPLHGPQGTFISCFETYWTDDEECREIFNHKWQPRSQNNSIHLMEAIKRTRIALKQWSSQKYGALPRTLDALRQQLQDLRQHATPSQQQIKDLNAQICNLELMEERYWKQRSRVEWLKCGDRNTKYFHHKANSRRRQNRIQCLIDDQGAQNGSMEYITSEFHKFFTGLFSKSNTDLRPLQTLEFKQLSGSSKQYLEFPYTEIEVSQALKDLPATKAPGSDGMHVLFLKKYWDIVGQDISTFVLDFLNNGGDISALNHTLICLVPKVQRAMRVTEYCPISLCNSLYKLISRVLVNRLKLVINEVVDDAQSAFVPADYSRTMLQ